jgi:hypothetical protein
MQNLFVRGHIWYRFLFIGVCLQQTFCYWRFHNDGFDETKLHQTIKF